MSAARVPHSLRRVVWSALWTVLGAIPAAAMPEAVPAVPGSAPAVVPAQAGAADASPDQEPAPELFDATTTALWDGRRTLQGVWVAHPLADSARRARIYNTETGAAVDGALFKRESSVTGPPVLVSSEAAQALGMAPGDEISIRIVALTPSQRRQPDPAADARLRAAMTPAPGEDAPEGTAPTRAAEPVPADTGRVLPAPPAAPVELDAAGSRVVVRSPSEATEAAAAEPVSRGGVFRPAPSADRWAELGPADYSPAEPAPAPAVPTLPAATLVDRESGMMLAAPPNPVDRTASALPPTRPSADAAGAPPEPPAGPWQEIIASAPVPNDFAGPPLAEALVVPPAAEGAESAPWPVPRPREGSIAPARGPDDSPGPAAADARLAPAAADGTESPPEAAAGPWEDLIASAPPPDDRAAPQPADALLALPYVQAGIFGVSANAERLIGRLRAADVPALGKATTVSGRPATRVLAGPFTTLEEREAALRVIRRMGLSDALPVAR